MGYARILLRGVCLIKYQTVFGTQRASPVPRLSHVKNIRIWKGKPPRKTESLLPPLQHFNPKLGGLGLSDSAEAKQYAYHLAAIPPALPIQ